MAGVLNSVMRKVTACINLHIHLSLTNPRSSRKKSSYNKKLSYIPRMLREAFDIKIHPNFNKEDGFSEPTARNQIIPVIKKPSRCKTTGILKLCKIIIIIVIV